MKYKVYIESEIRKSINVDLIKSSVQNPEYAIEHDEKQKILKKAVWVQGTKRCERNN